MVTDLVQIESNITDENMGIRTNTVAALFTKKRGFEYHGSGNDAATSYLSRRRTSVTLTILIYVRERAGPGLVNHGGICWPF